MTWDRKAAGGPPPLPAQDDEALREGGHVQPRQRLD